MAFDKEIQVLIEAEEKRVAVGPISDLVPGGLSLEDAHTICETIIQGRIEAGTLSRATRWGHQHPVREQMGRPTRPWL